jgi:hypothetical protein
MQIIEMAPQKYRKPSEEEKSKAKDKWHKMQKEGSKMVKGMFEFLDAQGGWLDFAYRIYPGEPIRVIKITHGEIVDLPMDVVKLLNNCYKKVRQMPKLDENGRPMGKGPIQKISRTRFTPMDAM